MILEANRSIENESSRWLSTLSTDGQSSQLLLSWRCLDSQTNSIQFQASTPHEELSDEQGTRSICRVQGKGQSLNMIQVCIRWLSDCPGSYQNMCWHSPSESTEGQGKLLSIPKGWCENWLPLSSTTLQFSPLDKLLPNHIRKDLML